MRDGCREELILKALSFVLSWAMQSVLLGLEVFTAGFVVLLLVRDLPSPLISQVEAMGTEDEDLQRPNGTEDGRGNRDEDGIESSMKQGMEWGGWRMKKKRKWLIRVGGSPRMAISE